ncbi:MULTISPECIES: NAD(P)H-dependent oxidoreductase [unclassified Corynebacterium]|uniref:NADPH-dependent FMN reductase n=1 Tax=unclassified Corynebacterium TaxID=2624378 RepID=UPI0029CA47D9|nr:MULTISPECIES: NAD(P)H-dependent oxidoreductase [unclassified Corynebacterium]WPF66836.1 NAD(P)H-dependent oxidoreductase [Corynebacterium sp. 22KM0430]WPF69324.1 NAD(P)H-dependent oxidoreductase [Corynebacterium sp. 21KM1197]
MKIGIIVGSIREGRLGDQIGQWVAQVAQARAAEAIEATNATAAPEFTLIDLRDFDLPLYAAEVLPAMANKQYADSRVQEWSNAIDACDAFFFVTPEYNHSVPGAMKNAVDSLGAEWQGKPLGFIGYSATGGIRAVEHWRAIMANFQSRMLRTQLDFSIFGDVTEGKFSPAQRAEDTLVRMIGELVQEAARA